MDGNHSCPMGSVGAVSGHGSAKPVGVCVKNVEAHPKVKAVGSITLLQGKLNVSHRLIGLHTHTQSRDTQ